MKFEEYKALIDEIDYHMNRYYNDNEPEISDYEYDQLMQKLKHAEEEHPDWVTSESPSQKIGGVAQREAGVKVTHDVPMLSIEDVFDKADVTAWIEKVHALHPDATFSVEEKIDGLSMSLRYERDSAGYLKLQLAETRGDGIVGEDVTANALVIPDVKQYLDLNYDELQLRGEVYMSHEEFERFNEIQEKAGKKLAANPRNLAAGTLRQLDAKITKERGLRLFVFNVQKGPNELTVSHCEGLDILSKAGVPTVFHKKCKTAEEVLSAIDEIGLRRGELEFDIDGAVVKIDEVTYRDDFPAGSKYSAGHIAYKYPPEERDVVIDDIIVDVGRTGKLTFTGVFHDKETGKPAKLCGTSVSKATLHNPNYIKEMQIGVGGIYKVYKSGEIIPKLNGCVEPPEKVFVVPKRCPVCGSILFDEDDTADSICVNPFCLSQLSHTLSYFASISAMNILGLGESLIDVLINNGFVSSITDIYRLKDKEKEILKIKGLEKTKFDKIINAIEKSKLNNPIQLLTGFGIRNVGKNTAKTLIKNYKSIDALSKATIDELVTIQDIGQVTAEYVYSFFNNPQNMQMLEDLKSLGLNMELLETSGGSNKLEGLTIVVTGTLEHFGRKEVTEVIENNGGKCTGSVSKKTNYLLAGEAAGSKLQKAQTLGVPIISEEEFMKMIQ